MAEHLLHAPQVGAALEEVRRERVPEEVRVDTRRVEPRLPREPTQDEEGARAREGAALRVQEELAPVAAVEVRPAARKVAAKRLCRLPPERDEALFVALPHAADDPVLDVDTAPLERDGLADAQPGAVEKLDERPVTESTRRRSSRGLDEPLNLPRGEGAGQPGPAPRKVDVGRGVVGPQAEDDEVPVQRSGRGGPPCDRAGRLSAGAQVGEPALDVVRSRGRRRAAEMCGEIGEVAPVRVHGAGGSPSGEESEEALDGGVHTPEFGRSLDFPVS
jgi:hypothetical protein